MTSESLSGQSTPTSACGETRPAAPDSDSRCEYCCALPRLFFRQVDEEVNSKSEFPIKFHKTVRELECSGLQGCDICLFLYRGIWFEEHYKYDYTPPIDANICFKISYYHGRDVSFTLFLEIEGRHHRIEREVSRSRYLRHPIDEENLRLPRVYSNRAEYVSSQTKLWISDCLAHHVKCGELLDENQRFLPTRLIDVGMPSQTHILRLVLSEDVKHNIPILTTRNSFNQKDYLTLSYCWGPQGHTAVTTQGNLQDRLTSIDISSLPKTFQDAITITRNIGIRYLWIDALCIIQPTYGDSSDWNREAPLMGDIYQHSLCTIAVSGGENCNTGCFSSRAVVHLPFFAAKISHPDDNQEQPIIIRPWVPSWEVAVESSPLSTRGWVLQERVLARRTLLCTKDGIFWECSQSRASEFVKDANEYYGNRSVVPTTPTLSQIVLHLNSVVDHDKQHMSKSSSWLTLMSQYSEKRLTKMEDRLPALLGMANVIQQATGYQYIAGVWKSDTLNGLSWTVDRSNQFLRKGVISGVPDKSTRISGIPSWSWASVNDVVKFPTSYEHLLRISSDVAFPKPANTTKLASDDGCDFEGQSNDRILNKTISPDISCISSECLVFSAFLGKIRLIKAAKDPLIGVYYYDCSSPLVYQTDVLNGPFPTNLGVVFDCVEEIQLSSNQEVQCVKWSSIVYRKSRHIGFIIIAPTEEKRCYRRIGFGEALEKCCNFEVDQTQITLI